MILIPPEAQENLENLTQFLLPDNSLRIYQDNQLRYGFRAGTLYKNFPEKDFTNLLEALATPKQRSWEITGGGNLLLDPKSTVNNYQLAASPFSLGLAVRDGKLSLSQALCGYWHLQGMMPTSVEPQKRAISEEIQKEIDYYLKIQPAISSPINSRQTRDNDVNINSIEPLTPLIEQELSDADVSIPSVTQQQSENAPNFYPSSDVNEIWRQQEWLNALIRERSLRRYFTKKDGKLVFTIGEETLEFRLNEGQQWEYVSGQLNAESLKFVQETLKQSTKSISSGLEFYQ